MSVIQDGDFLILQRFNYLRTHKLKLEKARVQLGKEVVLLKAIVGQPYETTFKMVKAKGQSEWDLEISHEEIDFETEVMEKTNSVEGADNRNLHDENKSQKLSKEDIETMKEEGKIGVEMIGKLIENSESFQQKTKFSQQKFLKKKAKKYTEFLVIRRPTLRMLMQIAYKDPTKVMNLRIDTLAQILNMANVRAGCKYLVYETGCQGLVVAGAVERLGEAGDGGKVIHVFQTGNPQTQSLNAMNFSKETLKKSLITLNMYHLRSLEQGHDLTSMHKPGFPSENNPNEESAASSLGEPSSNLSDIVQDPNLTVRTPARQKSREMSIEAFSIMNEKKMDGLIVVCKQHPSNILSTLLKYLAPSRPFVVFSPYKEPLLDAYIKVKESGTAIMVTLSETWLRHHQVMPGRTHPEVMMSGGGGYILSGIFVDNTEPEGSLNNLQDGETNGNKKKFKRFRRR